MDLVFVIVVFTAGVAALIVGLLVIGLIGMSIRVRRARATPTSGSDQPQSRGGLRAIVDESIGMYILRRLTGRSSGGTPKSAAPETPSLTADEIAYRLRLNKAAAPVWQAPEASQERRAAPSQAASVRAASTTAATAPRERLVRDSGLALAGLLTLGVMAFLIWPAGGPSQQPAGTDLDVAGASGIPEPSTSGLPEASAVVGAAESPGGSVAAETFAPSPGATPASSSAPRATAKPTPRGSSIPTPTPRLSASPRPTSSPSPTSGSTPTPMASATPVPTPEPPTPEPPTPEPPTPEPPSPPPGP